MGRFVKKFIDCCVAGLASRIHYGHIVHVNLSNFARSSCPLWTSTVGRFFFASTVDRVRCVNGVKGLLGCLVLQAASISCDLRVEDADAAHAEPLRTEVAAFD